MMIDKQTLQSEVQKALEEIGSIEPWFDEEVAAFVFEHPAYPVRYAGHTKEEVIENFPFYLSDFIEERLKDNLAPFVERKTTGRGGFRPGAGRPKGTKGPEKKRIYVPVYLLDEVQAFIEEKEKEHVKANRGAIFS